MWLDMVRQAVDYIKALPHHMAGFQALAIDMTARNVQDDVKKRGLPWTVSKGFDTFTPIGCDPYATVQS
jgi:2-keto-4-pentenoate hydratase/2-oxohepta-3-ene-1,7-dioic acid hydratase in catechol pathway